MPVGDVRVANWTFYECGTCSHDAAQKGAFLDPSRPVWLGRSQKHPVLQLTRKIPEKTTKKRAFFKTPLISLHWRQAAQWQKTGFGREGSKSRFFDHFLDTFWRLLAGTHRFHSIPGDLLSGSGQNWLEGVRKVVKMTLFGTSFGTCLLAFLRAMMQPTVVRRRNRAHS